MKILYYSETSLSLSKTLWRARSGILGTCNFPSENSEFCYQSLIKQLLQKEDIYCEIESPIYFRTQGINFGWGKADILVRGKSEIIIIELKANVRSHIKAEKQLQRYMVHFETTLPKVGLLFMFNSLDRKSVVKRVFT